MGALYGIFQKGVLNKYPALVVTAWGYTFGLGEILMTVVPSLGDDGFFHVPVSTIGPLVYAIILNSALGYFLMVCYLGVSVALVIECKCCRRG